MSYRSLFLTACENVDKFPKTQFARQLHEIIWVVSSGDSMSKMREYSAETTKLVSIYGSFKIMSKVGIISASRNVTKPHQHFKTHVLPTAQIWRHIFMVAIYWHEKILDADSSSYMHLLLEIYSG
ncbi:hypothetical protein HYALB_00008646 [Hymenoscyphus albidus]|uniref:Uncharacterized protein n=1 Tax=Hymenoscyphus albidus TaxID=595503 RepID=A0A9N9LHJ9_9HELO|nr:hypothetical protein HYALB_00008646 [Hymenoscyphus albidus]